MALAGRSFEFSNIGRLVFLLCCLALAYSKAYAKIPLNDLKCGVCQAVYHEVEHAIANTKQTHLVQTRFRVDEKKRVPYARTEFRLMEIFEEDISPRLQHYGVRGKAGEREVVKKPDPTLMPTPVPIPTPAPADSTAADDTVSAPPATTEQTIDSQATPTTTSAEASEEEKEAIEVEKKDDEEKKEEAAAENKRSKRKSKDGIQHSPGIVKSMRAIYSEWLSDFEDEMVALFRESRHDTMHRLCVDLLEACKQVPPTPTSSPKEEL